MKHSLFTSEAVGIGHPDKVADQISDAILDACLEQDENSRVACETMVTLGLVVVAGEITTKAQVDYQEIVRNTLKYIGYDQLEEGFDYRSCGVLTSIHKQSLDIAQGINEREGLYKEQGAGDQGIMFGYACEETPELMPLPITLAHQIVRELHHILQNKQLPYLRPDAKTQITIEYDEKNQPIRLHTVVISVQHAEGVKRETIVHDMQALVHRIAPKGFITDNTLFYINPTGRFVIGGPAGDCGLTGRKIIVDTYGGMGHHGGGAFSGKDPSKVDRSASYAARYVAKNIVAAKLARRCEVQISYAIGVSHPLSIKVDTFGTGSVSEDILSRAVPLVFDLTPKGIIQMLNLKKPIYLSTAFGGHFGRHEENFTWEKTDKIISLLECVKMESFAAG
ncbi:MULTISPECIES: methionine adenosyltransferase [unclassified Neochlamydia]|uniref:methionine adenosyltransferase n=1 Tax=unclassified Neochlamydia TaxID=2643326 RepID=UPI00140B8AA9|nr:MULTISPECIES: methionine adenosyltransferase [unclassified Neochlamydia]MBS4165204.1 S-adenosylmethionine synthase [Neochlamydia sp. AcF65]MBS4170926.1 S-adenosylmethionine synthase [Neochlamydia sp. AcF95]